MSTKRDLIEYAVEGSGEFPFDMLRYDQSFPATEQDSRKMSSDYYQRRIVVLWAFIQLGTDRVPTHDRWRSFLWAVVAEPRRVGG